MVQRLLSKCLSEYGMLVVLILLCAYYSIATIQPARPDGPDGGADCARQLLARSTAPKHVVIVIGNAPEDRGFADEAKRLLASGGLADVHEIAGGPLEVRQGLESLESSKGAPDAIITTAPEKQTLDRVLEHLTAIPAGAVIWPQGHDWPTFLTSGNLLNIANQIVVIAIMAVGMTMVIITGGIDLSVGSLVALSAVVTGIMIRDYAGGMHAGTFGLIGSCLAGVAVCALVGMFTGLMITLFDVPPFIVTLAMMLVSSGLSYKWSRGQSIYDVPEAFTWLGRGTGLLRLPNEVWLMLIGFVAAHVMMSRTRLGRYIYAVGGNIEAARLSGVATRSVLMIVYVISGITAGLGGVIVASQLKGSSPTYGLGYELYVIAAVVVGGTSLAGGEGNIIATLIGVLIIAVIQNGMNLTGVDANDQKIVLGLVILGAVLLDRTKKLNWRLPAGFRMSRAKASSPMPEQTATNARMQNT